MFYVKLIRLILLFCITPRGYLKFSEANPRRGFGGRKFQITTVVRNDAVERRHFGQHMRITEVLNYFFVIILRSNNKEII
jgi:hypothetical protein